MECPRCGFTGPDERECLKCGIVFSKWSRVQHLEDEENDANERQENDLFRAYRSQWRPSGRVREVFYISLARMLESGATVVESIQIAKETNTGKLVDCLKRVTTLLTMGDTFAKAIAPFPGVFPHRLKVDLAAGERIGDLVSPFRRAAERIVSGRALRRRLMRKSVSVLVLLFFWSFIGPVGAWVTGGNYASQVAMHLGSVILFFLVMPFLFVWALRNTALGEALKALAWKRGVPGGTYRIFVRAAFIESLASHLSGGITINQAIPSSAEVALDATLTKRLEEGLERGDLDHALHALLNKADVLEKWEVGQIVAAEKSGTLVDVLQRISKLQKDRFEQRIITLVTFANGAIYLFVLIYLAIQILSAFQAAHTGAGGLMEQLDGEYRKVLRQL
jgi:general secretion pathway protein F